MRTLCCALALLLPACLEYEITVTTTVAPDGTVQRSVAIRARSDKEAGDPWKRLRRPGAPYALNGDPEKGFVATAALKPGRHPSGLAVLLGDPEKVEDCPAAEGTVDVRATDLLVGTMYRYEERIALGTDAPRFREEVPRWLDTGLRVLIEALRIRFPDIDFAPVEARARDQLLPLLQTTTVNLHHAWTAIFLEGGPHGSMVSLAPLARSEFWPAVVRELASQGFQVPADEAGLKALEEDDGAGERIIRDGYAHLVDRLLAPLPEAQRAEVKGVLLADEALDEELEAAKQRVGLDEGELVAFLARGLGAYAIYGFFDSFDLRFRLTLPGKPLRANGDLADLPAISWRLGKDGDLLLVPPVLRACSFLPAKGVAAEGWDLATLAGIEGTLGELDARTRADVAVVVAEGIATGTWDDGGLSDGGKNACREIRDAIEAAKAR